MRAEARQGDPRLAVVARVKPVRQELVGPVRAEQRPVEPSRRGHPMAEPLTKEVRRTPECPVPKAAMEMAGVLVAEGLLPEAARKAALPAVGVLVAEGLLSEVAPRQGSRASERRAREARLKQGSPRRVRRMQDARVAEGLRRVAALKARTALGRQERLPKKPSHPRLTTAVDAALRRTERVGSEPGCC